MAREPNRFVLRVARVLVPALFVMTCVWLLLPASAPGPDYGMYRNWARAFRSGDIFRLKSQVLSPMNVPLTQWSHGTGLLFALGAALPYVKAPQGPHIAAWLAILAFWWAMGTILCLAADGEPSLVLLGLASMFLGTHAGYYSFVHGSETFSLALVALVTWVLASRAAPRTFDAVLLGIGVGLLIVVRPYLALYGIPAVAILAIRFRPRKPLDGLAALLGLLLPIALALFQVGLTTRWMTGSAFHSPYVFSAGAFQSFAWTEPEILAILVHPWHGLLVYHPLYGLGFLALCVTLVRAPNWWERCLYLALVAAILVHLYIQAAWYVWWLGTGTFGMRGMSAAAVVVIPPLVRVIVTSRSTRPVEHRLWVVSTIALCVWSYFLLRQGDTQFYTYGQLLAGQRDALQTWLRGSSLAWDLVALLVVALASWLRRNVIGNGTILLAGLTLGYTVSRLGIGSRTLIGTVVLLVLGAGVVWVSRVGVAPGRELRMADAGRRVVGPTMALVFVAALVLFAKLAIPTERWIAVRTAPPGTWLYVSAIDLPEIRDSYREYLQVHGFRGKKAGLLQFLQSHGIDG
jgi:hypothetical protein